MRQSVTAPNRKRYGVLQSSRDWKTKSKENSAVVKTVSSSNCSKQLDVSRDRLMGSGRIDLLPISPVEPAAVDAMPGWRCPYPL